MLFLKDCAPAVFSMLPSSKCHSSYPVACHLLSTSEILKYFCESCQRTCKSLRHFRMAVWWVTVKIISKIPVTVNQILNYRVYVLMKLYLTHTHLPKYIYQEKKCTHRKCFVNMICIDSLKQKQSSNFPRNASQALQRVIIFLPFFPFFPTLIPFAGSWWDTF